MYMNISLLECASGFSLFIPEILSNYTILIIVFSSPDDNEIPTCTYKKKIVQIPKIMET